MADEDIENSPLNIKRNKNKKPIIEDEPMEYSSVVRDILDNKVEMAIPTQVESKKTIEHANNQSEKKEKARIGLVNQASTIKISKEAKKKFDAIRMATGAPSAYQLLELMMDAYYEQHLTPAQKQVVDATSVI